MNGAFYIGATGLGAQERALGVLSNNIANLNTPAFKRADVRFAELVATRAETEWRAPGPPSTRPVAAGTESAMLLPPSASPDTGMAGVAAGDPVRDFGQGALRETGRPLDIAINGEGFIELLGPRGETLLWRGGSLKVGADNYLTTVDGLALRAGILVPDGATDLSIGADGQVWAVTAGEAGAREIGAIELVGVRDPAALEPQGDGLYAVAFESDLVRSAAGEAGAGTIVQGALEASNVQLSDEMVALLLVQRAYAASAQIVQAGDQLMAIANGLRR